MAAACCAAALGCAPALAADLPDAVKPGAARPGAERPILPAPPAPKVFDVPAVPERPLDIDEGERVQVQAFELLGAVDRPERGILITDVQALADRKLAERPEGFTVGRLQEVADEITKYYRERGLILAQAFIPVQTVSAGTVEIQILEGMLGRVVAEGQKMYKEKVLQQPFEELVGKPVTKEQVEAALLQLNEYPGVSLFGVFQPGQQVGTADMVVKVQDERRLEATVRGDNHGIRETGRNRYRLEGTVNNLTGTADRFTGTLQHTASPTNSFYWGAEYERPFWRYLLPDSLVSVRFDRNQFDVGGEFRDRDITSDTRNLFLTLSNQFIRSRQRNLSGRIELARKRAVTSVRSRPQSKDNLTPITFGADYDSVDTRFAGLNAGFVEVSHGFNDFLGAMGETPGRVRPSRQGGNREFAQGEFDKVFLSYSRLQSLTPLTEKLRHHTLLFRAELQWSPDLMVPLEQYSIGGPTNVRAYQPTERLFDRAAFGSIEWIINAPGIADQPAFGNRTWGEIIQVSLFFDYAAGKLNSALATEKASDNLKGAGFSISINNPQVFTSKLTIAAPVGRPESVNGKNPQYWLDLNFFF